MKYDPENWNPERLCSRSGGSVYWIWNRGRNSMGLLEHIVVKPTGRERFLTWNWHVDEYDGPLRIQDLACYSLWEHRIRLEVTALFRAKDGRDYEDQLRRAKVMLLDTLYEDVHDALSGIVQAIGYGEREKALDLCDNLRRTLRGEES